MLQVNEQNARPIPLNSSNGSPVLGDKVNRKLIINTIDMLSKLFV